MSGKLAARQNDMTMKGGKIVQGLAGALITPDNTVAWRMGKPIGPGKSGSPGTTDTAAEAAI